MSIVPFPATPNGQRPDGGGQSVADAVDRYLDGIQATTTRVGYAETLVHLTAITSSRDAATLQPEDYATVMARWDRAAAATWNRQGHGRAPERPVATHASIAVMNVHFTPRSHMGSRRRVSSATDSCLSTATSSVTLRSRLRT